MDKNDKILITGGSGLVGRNLLLRLKNSGYENIKSISSKECDLTDKQQTNSLFESYKPDYVFHAAAYVRGIMGNAMNKGKSFYLNSIINLNVVEACRLYNVKKITALGTGAVYSSATTLLKEENIWNGPPHGSEGSYAHAKRGLYAQLLAYKESYGLNFAFVVSGNLYGPFDNFDTINGHVIPSLLKKFYDAKTLGQDFVSVWGNGTPQRDFIYSPDFSKALELIMLRGEGAINMGSGEIKPIQYIVDTLTSITGIPSKFDTSKPNGELHRGYDLTKLSALGFAPKYTLEQGLFETYKWLEKNYDTIRA